MRKVLVLLFVVLLLAIGSGCSSEIEQSTYTNSTYGFSVNYPSNWEVRESANIYDFCDGVDSPWQSIYFFEEYHLVFVGILTISHFDERRISFDLDYFCEEFLRPWADDDEFNLLVREDIIINGISAEKITFEYYNAPEVLLRESLILFANREMSPDKTFYYAIEYDAPVSLPKGCVGDRGTYDEGYKYFDIIVNSFKFTNMKE